MATNRSIKDFFKPYTIPRNRIPDYESEDEIVVAPRSPRDCDAQRSNHPKSGIRKIASPPRKAASLGSATARKQKREKEGLSFATPTAEKTSSPRDGGAREVHGDAVSMSSALSSLRSSQSPHPTRVRQRDAVMIPSPRRETIVPTAPVIVPGKPSTSFSSVLSSVPHSSQSSSRRIIKNGIQAVTNSDSASVTSSDDDLADIDSFMPQKRRKLNPQPEPHAADPISIASSSAKSLRASARLSTGRSVNQYRPACRPPSPPPTVTYKHSLLNIVKQNQEQAESEAKIAEAVAEVKEAESKDVAAEQADGNGSAGAIAAAFTSTSEDYERMKAAIERTEAMKAEETFYFFGGEVPSRVEALEAYDFNLVEKGLEFLGCEADLRTACSSGFLSVLATKMILPTRLVEWIQRALLSEKSTELCEAYVAVIAAVVHSGAVMSNDFASLRLPELASSLQSDVTMKSRSRQPPKNLKYVLQAMRVLVQLQDHTQCVEGLAELVMLNNDETVRFDADLQHTIEATMSAFMLRLEGSSDKDECSGIDRTRAGLVERIVENTKVSTHMLARAIASIPATTPHLHDLRRRLALCFLLEATGDEDITHKSPNTGVRLLVRLKHHHDFAISERTDYTLLLSLTYLLDIAIDAGFSDFAFLSHKNPKPTEFSASTSSLFPTAAKCTSSEETEFNAQVDALVAQLTQMKNCIRDAGTSHLKRTEAKSALDRLVVRLEYAVRTRLKPRKDVFDQRIQAGSGLVGFLKRIVKDVEVMEAVGGAEAAKSEVRIDDVPGS